MDLGHPIGADWVGRIDRAEVLRPFDTSLAAVKYKRFVVRSVDAGKGVLELTSTNAFLSVWSQLWLFQWRPLNSRLRMPLRVA
jgi:hypothetical protein